MLNLHFSRTCDGSINHLNLYSINSGIKIYYSFVGSNLLRSQLCSAILKIGDIQKRSTNLNADMTGWAMQDDEPFKSLAFLAKNMVTQISDTYFFRPDIKWKIKSCWGARYVKGDSSQLHDHYPATWSVSYYAYAPTGSSPIVFPGAEVSITPEDGLMLVFPGNIEHEVPPSVIDEDRIIVSMNFFVEKLKSDRD